MLFDSEIIIHMFVYDLRTESRIKIIRSIPVILERKRTLLTYRMLRSIAHAVKRNNAIEKIELSLLDFNIRFGRKVHQA